ncbi:MAG: methylmalonyl Co-A mutase-associated GTPase MeaB [Odoribacteraceae bacterium]|nr:methylmalonyl Co-A mutase-associated GTPase MeaB [Odoribacteraceae bacterium]
MEHPENDSRYVALTVNKGIERPDPVNPDLADRLRSLKRKSLSTDDFLAGILAGDINVLSQAITLAESARADHQEQARVLINRCLHATGRSARVGVTGVPGAGKSTFIEALGKSLTAKGHKIAVLAIDPSSERSRGSILGDKTRMEELARDPNAYIRPSPSAGSLGGVARKTREAMLLCEAAGFDVILVETVGVGQSEIAVHSMVDFFLLLQIAGAGDELQGIKRGIMEMANMIVVNKADGDNVERAELARVQLKNALHLFPPHESGVEPVVITASASEKRGIEQAWEQVMLHREATRANGFLERHRGEQALYWMHETINEQLKEHFYRGQKEKIIAAEERVSRDEISSFAAAFQLLDGYFRDR